MQAPNTPRFRTMSLRFRRRADLSEKQIAELQGALATFYQNPPSSY